jgi:TRAP-type uncharacterized transport system substrate-binding protein
MRFFFSSRTLPAVCVSMSVVVVIWLASSLWIKPTNSVIRMSAGPDQTRRHAVATYFCEQAAQYKLNIHLESTKGSEDCLKRIKGGELDAAIVSNGVILPDDDEIRVLAAVQLEAVHLLVRNGIEDGESLVETIRGKRVNLDERGSTDWLLAREFLDFAQLKLPTDSQSGDFVPTEYSKEQLFTMAMAILDSSDKERDRLISDLPDCLIVVGSMPSALVQQLVEAAEYRIMPLPGTQAFLMDNLQSSNSRTTVIAREFLEQTTIPRNSYFGRKGVPETNCDTVGVRLLVVASKNLHAAAVQSLMKAIFEGEFSRRIKPKTPHELATPFLIHPNAEAYLNRDKPLAFREVLDWFTEGFSLFGAFSAGALSLYGLLRSKRARKPSDYYSQIRKVNQEAVNADFGSTKISESTELAKHLDNRLQTMRQQLIDDICDGRIKGDQVVANILLLLKDSQQNIPRMNRSPLELNELRMRARSATSEAA